jgi:dTDP-4-amino-4,6-dideoxygalactose transaminase
VTQVAHCIAPIEDCAQAHGARIHGQSVGSFGDVAAWSFCQDKILTTAGEGGMVTTHRADLWDAMWAFKDHGRTHEAVYGREHPPGFRWLHKRYRFASLRLRLQLPPHRAAECHRPHPAAARVRVHRPRARNALPPEGITQACYKFYAFVKPRRPGRRLESRPHP